jgi:hypothetical protein
MRNRVSLVAASGAALVAACVAAAGCFQELDTAAASGPGLGAASTDAGAAPDVYTSWQICQSPSCDQPSGEIPFLDTTPLVYLPDGATTANPCDDVEQASIGVRQTYCTSCHQSPANRGGIDFILDDSRLVGAVSQTATDDAGQPLRLVVPGDPAHSWLYARVAGGVAGSAAGMPPPSAQSIAGVSHCTASDLSVLYGWIFACVPGTDGGAYDTPGVDYAPGAQSTGNSGGVLEGGAD